MTSAGADAADGECIVQTSEFGEAPALLHGISCSEAAEVWQEVDGNNEPSGNTPVAQSPEGWECFVYSPDFVGLTQAGQCLGGGVEPGSDEQGQGQQFSVALP